MRLNEKYFRQCATEPVDVQKMDDGSIVEIHIMNDNPFYEKVINQGQFSVWSVDDSNLYRVFLEEGYYQIMKELFSTKIDGYWVKYWADCDKARRSFFFKVMLPIIVLYYGILFIVGTLLLQSGNQSASTIMLILGLVGVFGIFSFGKRVLTKKIKDLNREVLAHIKKVTGAKKFEALIKKQRQYCADFFKVEESEEAATKEEIKAPALEKPLENKEELVSDSIPNDEINDSKEEAETDEIKKEEK